VSKVKIAFVAFIWLFLLATGVVIWKVFLQPEQKAEAERQRETKEKQSVEATQGTSRYQHELACGVDAFSGYALLRSQDFRDRLGQLGIRMAMQDDKADYGQRMDALESGKLQFAAFPVDALVKACSQRNKLPVTIVALIDETRGADAMIAYKERYASVDSLNRSETRFVLVGDSPSETLARVVVRDFELSKLSKEVWKRVDSPEAVVQSYKKATPATDEVFVTWEPFVSQLLENDSLHVLVDSSKFTGFIVDALVVSRDFLLKEPAIVEKVIESYFRSANVYRDAEKLKQLVLEDAKQTGSKLTTKQADRLLAGIHWKNTQENYAHFGLRNDRVVHIEDIIQRITSVLRETGAMANDPTGGQASKLYYDKVLASLKANNFLPDEIVRKESELVALNDKQWESLVPVGTLSVPELVFARGTATLTATSRQTLEELAIKLQSWPAYYLKVEGNAASGGNSEANLALASQRAQAAMDYLKSLGVSAARMKSVSGKVGQSRVMFILSEMPY
jgi:outer membrane protein OmpA-like peptidoglycan-associated protein